MWCTRSILSGLTILLTATLAPGQDDAHALEDPPADETIAWLREHAVPLRTINPDDDDFADLQPLKMLIGDARIVQLGEQTHGDGATFQAKTRLIKFLHQEMGFDVIAFESGLYDCRKAWERYRAGEESLEAAEQGIFAIWTRSEQVQPVLEYIGSRVKTGRPLELCGFDCQFTALASSESLVDDFGRFIAAFEPAPVDERTLGRVTELLTKLAARGFDCAPPRRTRMRWQASVHALRLALARPDLVTTNAPEEIDYWRQLLQSTLALAKVTWQSLEDQSMLSTAQQFNPRDAQMADNMIWLARERYPDRKIIIWAATMHIARNLYSIDTQAENLNYGNVEPMGHLLSVAMADAVFTIGFTAYEGRAGLPWGDPWDVPPAADGSFEDLCVKADLDNAFIMLRGLAADAPLRRPLSMRPLGHAEMIAHWTHVLDAVVFTRTMTPSTTR